MSVERVINSLSEKKKKINKAAVYTINKTSTFSKAEAINKIASKVNLKKSYISGKIRTAYRASETRLRSAVRANNRSILLSRYPHMKMQDGYKVAVNRSGGYREIKGARMIKSLRGSGGKAIAVRNKDAVEIFAKSMGKGLGITSGKTRKLSSLKAKAASKPYGMTPLHSRSINQLFTDARLDIQPQIKTFMSDTFLKELRR